MNESFSVCASEMYQRKYMDFLLTHYVDLRLPYPFPDAFGFIASPVLLGQECFLCLDDEGKPLAHSDIYMARAKVTSKIGILCSCR